ncbi:MAG: exodeoxyribonuclease VII large subunit [Clostridia bacterium]|nr:exodeoxyribonuclease VII large subunit [Clostridia bacterium]
MEQKAISVSQLSGYIKGIFEAEGLLHNIMVFGEISGVSILRGNAYFSLKDEEAILSCVFFGADGTNLKNGDLVVVTGTPRYYVKGGKLNFNVVKVEPYGIGELFKKFLETKERLAQEGLFDEEKKKPIPKNIKRIGVVTSEMGAVIQDIINVTTRRDKSIDIVLYPTRVQGEGADKDIIEGIKFFDNYDVDVIIVARGGGSFEDLMPFNSEELARVAFDCKKMLVSAVGHETDFTIIDFVSDLIAPTPSAAAELVVSEKRGKIAEVISKYDRIASVLVLKATDADNSLKNLRKDFEVGIKNLLNDRDYSINLINEMLEKLNPRKLLERGFAKIERNGEGISGIGQLKPQDSLEIYLKDGKITSEVVKLEPLKINKE